MWEDPREEKNSWESLGVMRYLQMMLTAAVLQPQLCETQAKSTESCPAELSPPGTVRLNQAV